MPKVTEEYFENKKKVILDAAYRLCLTKTVSTVTMLDIIREVGLSKGGIYRFYSDINVLLADMLDRLREKSQFKQRLDAVMEHMEERTVKENIYAVFELLGIMMEEELMGMEKIDFELNVLAMNAPERIKEILQNTRVQGNKEYLSEKTRNCFVQAQQSGKIKFHIPPEELLSFITSAYMGIQMTCIVNRCYYKVSDFQSTAFSPVKQMRLLAEAVCGFIE